MSEKDELRRMCTEGIVAQFKILCHNFPRQPEENQVKSARKILNCGPSR